jgi:ABC-2 type transport system ATP-binding protein
MNRRRDLIRADEAAGQAHPRGDTAFRLPPEAARMARPYRRRMPSISSIELDSLAVQTIGLGKRFGPRAALEGVDLEVPRGVAFGFLGANGAGKTTLIRLLLGLAEPTAGRVRVLGRDVAGDRAAALSRVGAIIEEPRFHPHLTGRENLRIHAAARERSAHARIDGALARVGLAARADDRVKTYSLGMRQRLGVARCLLADPELLILDEPMNGLDPAGIIEMRHLIRELVGEGRTVLLSSHLLDEVEKTCDLAAIVDQGRVLAQGTIHELVRGGPRAIDIVCHSPLEAATLLAAVPGVTRAADHGGGLRVTLSPEAPVDREIVTALLRRLLDHGVAVERVAPVAASLEDRFLTMTTPLEERS